MNPREALRSGGSRQAESAKHAAARGSRRSATDYDIVVIGGGAAGLSAARTAGRRRARVLLVQQGATGGECTYSGCVPSKTLLAAAARGASFGDARAAVARAVGSIAATETDEVLAREGVEVRHGWATLVSPREVDVEGRRVRAGAVVVATGAGPVIPPIPGLPPEVLTNENVFALPRLPNRLTVIGGGGIGCELAQAFQRLGAQVTVVELRGRLLCGEEPEASAAIGDALVADGVDVRAGRAVVGCFAGPDPGSVLLNLDDGTTLHADRVLVAAGRRPNLSGLGLEAAGVETRDGFIRTDARLATTARGVWAAGDVTGLLLFTHAADLMGRIAASNALSPVAWRRFDPAAIPWVTFTSPEVGRVGLTEAQAASAGGRVAFLPMAEVDRAVMVGEPHGFVKLIAGPRRVAGMAGGGRLLGATMVAGRGGELIHEAVLAMNGRLPTARLALATHAYPSWSVAVQQAASQFFVTTNGRRARRAQPASDGELTRRQG